LSESGGLELADVEAEVKLDGVGVAGCEA